MMLMNWKNDPVKPKPTRFNLGGLLKRRITRRRSTIDSLAASLDGVLLDLSLDPHHQVTGAKHDMAAALGAGSHPQTNRHMLLLLLESRLVDLAGPCATELLSAATSTTSYPVTKNYTPIYHTEERYTSFTTECISLQNSDMTLHIDLDDADADSDADSLADPQLHHYEEPVCFDAKAEESIADYRAGGYHPVKIGDWYSSGTSRYQVIRKLGWGHFSTVWLCCDVGSGRYVALKIVKLGKNYADAAKDEISILRGLQGHDHDDHDDHLHHLSGHPETVGNSHLVRLLDDFEIRGVNGSHLAMVFELMGESMLNLMIKYKTARHVARHSIRSLRHARTQHLLRLDLVRLIAHQLFTGVDYMHRNGVIHTDLKPENILMTFDGSVTDGIRNNLRTLLRFQILPSEPLVASLEGIDCSTLKVKVADLGNATYSNLHFTNHIQTRQYRSPEIILKHKNWGALADMWSLGCVLFELMTGDYLFDPNEGQTFSKHEDHLAQIIELLGEFPSEDYLSQCELADEFFDSPSAMHNIPTLKFWSLEKVLIEKYRYNFDDDNVKHACDIILKCLKFNTNERYDCGSLLAHPWFQDAPFVQQEVDMLPNHNSEIRGFTCEE